MLFIETEDIFEQVIKIEKYVNFDDMLDTKFEILINQNRKIEISFKKTELLNNLFNKLKDCMMKHDIQYSLDVNTGEVKIV